MTDHSLNLSYAQWDFMRRYVISQTPLEGCGLLAGKNGVVEDVLPIKNAEASGVRFRMEPKAQLEPSSKLKLPGSKFWQFSIPTPKVHPHHPKPTSKKRLMRLFISSGRRLAADGMPADFGSRLAKPWK